MKDEQRPLTMAERFAILEEQMRQEARQAPHGPVYSSLILRSELCGLAPVEPLIEGILSYRATALLVGSTGIGKTFVALSMMNSVVTGNSWLGHDVRRTSGLYVCGEGAAGLNHRVSAWEFAWGRDIRDGEVGFVVRPPSLSRPATWEELAELAIDRGAGFVILDTLSSLAPDVDETRDAAVMTRRMSDLADAIDGTVLMVHHPGWADNKRSRGGYQLEANVDEVLVLTGTPDSDLLELTRKKVKNGEDGQRVWLRRRSYADSAIIEKANAQDSETPMRARVLAALTAAGEIGLTASQLKDVLALPESQRSQMYRVLQDLVRGGQVVSEGPRGRARYYMAERS